MKANRPAGSRAIFSNAKLGQYRKSQNDVYLRDRLVVDIFCSEHPVAQKLLRGTVIRSVRTNRSIIGRAALAGGRERPMYTFNGLYLGHYPTIPIDDTRLNETFQTMVRGLYFKILNKRLPEHVAFKLGRLESPTNADPFMAMKKSGANGPYCLGDVFCCSFFYATEDHVASYWLLCFYSGFFVTIQTTSQSGLPSEAIESDSDGVILK